MIWSVPREWEDETVVVIGGGPSLRGVDVAKELSGTPVRVITINNSYDLVPRADVHYFQDVRWLQGKEQKTPRLTEFGFWVSANATFNAHPHVHALRLTGESGFDPRPDCLKHGWNSGYQAIHLAMHFGVARILLLGYDMRPVDGVLHYHKDPRPTNMAQLMVLSMLPMFPTLIEPLRQRGIEVINCTPGSALKCWPYVPLREALQETVPVQKES